MNELSLVFNGPAGAWNEALPLGNGSMGAMSYGWLREEKIELNLDTLWSGTGRSKENKNTDVDWDFLRQKIFDGKYEEAEAYCKENILGDWTESYLPAGNLHIDANIPELKVVFMITTSNSSSGNALFNFSITRFVWASASFDPLVPTRYLISTPVAILHFQWLYLLFL